MNNKITIQDLADQISVLSGQSKKLSEAFLRALTEIVEDSLEKDGIAKVKGIGTFKIIAIEERKSVNVTDGSTVIIPAHKKITFTPEKELKEAVNKPYEHLETYVLPNDGPVDAPETDDDENFIDEELTLSVDQTTIPSASEQTAPTGKTTEAADPVQPSPTYSEPTISNVSSSVKDEQTVSTPKAVFEEPTISTERANDIQQEASREGRNGEEVNNIPQEPISEVPENVSVEETKEETATTSEQTETTACQETQQEDEPKDKRGNDSICEEEPKAEEPKTETVKETENSEEPIAPKDESDQEQKEPQKATEPSIDTPTNQAEGSKDEHEKKGKKNLLIVIILLIILIVLCVFIGLNKSPQFKAQMEGLKEKVTSIFGIEQKKNVVVPLHPAPEPEKDEFFEEKKEDMYEAAQADPEFPELVVEEEKNYDWFEEDFKKFLNKEYPKIHFEVTGEPIIDTIKSGKTLTSMSRKYYNGCKDFWVYIYLYNKDVIKRPDDVPAGTVIKIPQLDQSVVNPESYESVNAAKDVKETYLRLFN